MTFYVLSDVTSPYSREVQGHETRSNAYHAFVHGRAVHKQLECHVFSDTRGAGPASYNGFEAARDRISRY